MSRKWLLICLSTCFFDKIDCCNENYSTDKLSSSPDSVLYIDDYIMMMKQEKKQKNTKPSAHAANLSTRDRSKSDSDGYGLGIFLASPKFNQCLTKPNLYRESSISSIQSHDSISSELYKSGDAKQEHKFNEDRIRSTSPIRECNTPPSPSPIREGSYEDKIEFLRKISSNSLITAITIKN
ncbi:MAG: hypothetical protein ACXWL5_02475 [Candidatus Chromulinivorax sp.]